jgi:hypothetical protein
MNHLRFLCFALVLVITVGACSKSHEHQTATAAHAHEHKAPHGGTAVVLGDEAYHLEFVHSPVAGTLTAFVLDAHMENFIRLNLPSFDVVANVGGEARPLTLHAVANTATGETIGDTSQFEAQADWLKSTTNFTATLKSLIIRGTAFTDVSFSIPQP